MTLRIAMLAALLLAPPLPLLAQLAEAPSGPPRPMVRTGTELPRQCLSSVRVHRLDGESVTLPTDGFELEPGSHSLNGSAELNLAFCPVTATTEAGPVPDLVADFEPGMIYHVGLDHRSADPREWRLVIWRIESADGAGAEWQGRIASSPPATAGQPPAQ